MKKNEAAKSLFLTKRRKIKNCFWKSYSLVKSGILAAGRNCWGREVHWRRPANLNLEDLHRKFKLESV